MGTNLAVSSLEECTTCLGILARNPTAKIVFCRDCRRNTLPKEYGNPWQTLIGHNHFRPEPDLEPSAAARKAIRRNERRATPDKRPRILAPKPLRSKEGLTELCHECGLEPQIDSGMVCGPCRVEVRHQERRATEALARYPEKALVGDE